jgi:hypothetical protein
MPDLQSWARQSRELARLFFARFLENDLICVDGDTRATLIGVVSLLLAPGVFLPFLEYIEFSSYPLGFAPWYVRDLAALPDTVLHIAFSMTVLGLFTVFEWDAILPDRRDVAVLQPLPVGLGTMFAARITALFALWVVLTLAADGVSGWFFPVAVMQNASAGILLWHIRCHLLALVAANLFIFLALIAIQGLLMSLLGWAGYRRFSPYAQFLLVVVILSQFFLSIGQAWGVDTNSLPKPLIAALPAWWFTGFDETQVGWHLPLFEALARFVPWVLALAAALAAGAYALSYRHCVNRAFDEHEAAGGTPSRLGDVLTRAINKLVVRKPTERAAFYFVWQTVTRNRAHRTLVAAWVGAGLALVLQGVTTALATGDHRWWANQAGPLLPAFIVLPVFLVTGLRYSFTVPSDLRANWLFRVSAVGGPAEYSAGVRKVTLLLVITPLCAILGPVYIVLWGWKTGGLHVLFGTVCAWLLLEAQLLGLGKVPFTCSYVPGKANLKTWWTIYVLGYLAYVAACSWLDLKILERRGLMVWFLLFAAAVWLAMGEYRKQSTTFDSALVFDERPEPVVRTLELGG